MAGCQKGAARAVGVISGRAVLVLALLLVRGLNYSGSRISLLLGACYCQVKGSCVPWAGYTIFGCISYFLVFFMFFGTRDLVQCGA